MKYIVKLKHVTYTTVEARDADHACKRAVAVTKNGRENSDVRAVSAEAHYEH